MGQDHTTTSRLLLEYGLTEERSKGQLSAAIGTELIAAMTHIVHSPYGASAKPQDAARAQRGCPASEHLRQILTTPVHSAGRLSA